MIRNNKGITLIALVTTIVILLILAGITITGSREGIKSSQDNTSLSELNMVQHAIFERYNKYKLTKDTSLLVGNIVTPDPLPEQETSWKLTQTDIGENIEKKYRKLEASHLTSLGLKAGDGDLEDTYIVNYYTGEVYNLTKQKTNSNQLLYLSM